MPICQRAPGTRSSCEIKKMDCTVQVDYVLTSLFMCEPLAPGILESFSPTKLEKNRLYKLGSGRGSTAGGYRHENHLVTLMQYGLFTIAKKAVVPVD